MAENETPEWIDQLAQICCESLAAERSLSDDTTRAQIHAIRDSASASAADQSVALAVEKRMRTLCQEPTIHRTAEARRKTEELERIWREKDTPGGSPGA